MAFRPLRQLLWQALGSIFVLLSLLAVWQYQSINIQQKQQQANAATAKIVHQLSEQNHVLGYLSQLKSLSSFDVFIKTPTTEYLPLDITNQLEQLAQLQQRIKAEFGKNQKLKQQASTIIAQQLQLTSELLVYYRQQQKPLKQQLQQQQMADALLKSRQQAFVQLTEQIQRLTQLKQALTQASFQLSLLQPKLDVKTFEISKQAVVELLRVWSDIEALLFTDSRTKLSAGFNYFNQLIAEPNLALSKWQGMLRLNGEYQQLLTQLSTQLSTIDITAEPSETTNQPISEQKLFIALLIVFAALLVWRLIALFDMLAALSDKLSPKWQQQATELTTQLAELNHQAQALEQLQQQQQCYTWCSSASLLLAWLKQYKLIDTKAKTWHQLLAFEQRKQLLQLLRTAKKQQQVQLIRIQDKQQRQWQLAVHYEQQQWQINLLNVSDYQTDSHELLAQVQHLTEQCNEQVQAQVLQAQTQLAQINSQIQQWQHQVLSSTVSVLNWQKMARFLYRQQSDCLRTIQALQLTASSQISNNKLAFNDWLKKLHWQQQLGLQTKKLHWLVDVDVQLHRQVELKQYAFMVWYQQLLTLLLGQVSQAEVVVQFKLVDQQHERGMVQLTINVQALHPLSVVNALQQWPEHSNDDHQTRLLKQLETQLFIEKFELEQRSQLTLSCQFPVTFLSAVDDDLIKQRKLAQHHWVIIAPKSYRQQVLAQLLSGYKAKVSSFETTEQFLAQHMAVEQVIYAIPEPITAELQSYLARHPQCKFSTVAQGHAIERVMAWWPEPLLFTSDLFGSNKTQPLRAWPDTQDKIVANILVYATQNSELNYLLTWLSKLGANINLALSKTQFEQCWQSGGYNLAFIDDDTVSITSESYSQQAIFALSDACYQKLNSQSLQSQQTIAVWPTDTEQWALALAPWILAKDHLADGNNIELLALDFNQLSVIDFVKFAQHQGCVEVAAVMLTEYIEQLEHHIQLLQQAVIKQQSETVEQQLTQSLNLSKMIAAEQLSHLLHALQSVSAKQLAHYLPQLQQQLADVQQQAQLL